VGGAGRQRRTVADATPSTAARASSTAALQWLHAMPPMRSIVTVLLADGTSRTSDAPADGTSGTSDALIPVLSMAATRAAGEAVPATIASSASRSTCVVQHGERCS
jgi:hypothetical protein